VQRLSGQTEVDEVDEVDEDLLRNIVHKGAGDEPHRTSTARAFEHVDGEDPLHERGPIEPIA
jgi:hypothetical protein